MAGLEAREKGALLDGRAPRVVRGVFRSWLQRTMRYSRDYAVSVSPEDTGTYKRSMIFRTRVSGTRFEGVLYSADIPGKVRVIEFGFPARPLKRQPKSGPTRMGKGREGRLVFHKTEAHMRGLLRSQVRGVEVELVRGLN